MKHTSRRTSAMRLPLGRWRTVLLAAAIAASVGIASSAKAEMSATCGAALSAADALRRLNELRLRGATCPETATPTTAAALSWSDDLAAAALLQAREMALLKRMGHRDRENRGLAERLRATGYRFSAAVENVAVGYPSLDDVVDAWVDSQGHCENLMNAAVLEFGLACIDGAAAGSGAAAGAAEDRRYWALVLGAPARSR